MRVSRHNGRSGAHGSYNPKHNDREFELEKAEELKREYTKNNLYWNCIDGRIIRHEDLDENARSFTDVEKGYYNLVYMGYVNGQNERNIKAGHRERCRTADDLRTNSKTCPEETIYQIGNMNMHVDPEVLSAIAVEFFDTITEKYGQHVHILDWALHLDENTPHIHERHVFDVTNRYGERQPKQEQALKELGFELPDPSAKEGKFNNRKMSYDAECRRLFFEICKKHGLELEEEPIYGGKKYKEKQEYVIDKLNTELSDLNVKYESTQQEYRTLEEKLSDTKGFLKEQSEIAYDNACEALADKIAEGVKRETAKEISIFKNEILKSDSILSKVVSKYAIEQLDKLLNSLSGIKARVAQSVKKSFATATTKEQITKIIAEKSKPSLLKALSRAKADIEVNNSNEMHVPVHKKNQDKSL